MSCDAQACVIDAARDGRRRARHARGGGVRLSNERLELERSIQQGANGPRLEMQIAERQRFDSF